MDGQGVPNREIESERPNGAGYVHPLGSDALEPEGAWGGHSDFPYTISMRSTARRARPAIAASTSTRWVRVSSAPRMFESVMRFMCGHRLHGRTNSMSGCWTATLSLIEHSVTRTTRRG